MKQLFRISALVFLFHALETQAQPGENITRLLGTKDHVLMADMQSQPIYAYGDDQPFVPASIIKILTGLVAIQQLGEDYRCTTEFWLDQDNTLTIVGKGDPLLVSESISEIAKQLAALGHTKFAAIRLDDSAIAWQQVDGASNSTNPYDAPNGALIANFNTVYVEKSAANTLSSAEKQTPLIPLARAIAAGLRPGEKVRHNLGKDRITALTQVHQLFSHIFAKQGIALTNTTMQLGAPASGASKLLDFANTTSMRDMVKAMLAYSNNYLANQIGMQLLVSQPTSTKGITVSQAAQRVTDYAINKLQIAPEDIFLTELSGLSRKNRITAGAMMQILQDFAPYATLLRTHKDFALSKTGTLKGVYNLAGYILSTNGKQPFIIHTYSKANNRNAILEQLRRHSLRQTQ